MNLIRALPGYRLVLYLILAIAALMGAVGGAGGIPLAEADGEDGIYGSRPYWGRTLPTFCLSNGMLWDASVNACAFFPVTTFDEERDAGASEGTNWVEWGLYRLNLYNSGLQHY